MVILHNPNELSITGALGPGQTTNIALSETIDQATRILAVASPSHGFDPATVDFSTITELISNEGLRPATDWAGVEGEITSICEEIDLWGEHSWNWESETQEPMLYISVRHQSDAIKYGNYDSYSMLMTNHDLVTKRLVLVTTTCQLLTMNSLKRSSYLSYI